MSSDSITAPLKSFGGGGNFFENIFSDVANVALQSATAGTVGYRDGGFTQGVTGDAIREGGRVTRDGLKQVTGAAAAEEANAQARSQYEQARVDAEAARVEQQNRTARDQVNKSQMAQSARSPQNRGGGSNGYGSFSISQDEQDFLGL